MARDGSVKAVADSQANGPFSGEQDKNHEER